MRGYLLAIFCVAAIAITSIVLFRVYKKTSPPSRASHIVHVERTHRVLPPMLLSEVRAERSRGFFSEQEFEINNRLDGEVSIALDRKSCSCVNVRMDDVHVISGEYFQLPPLSKSRVRIDAILQAVPTLQTVGATFKARGPMGDLEDVDLHLECTVIPDVQIEPPNIIWPVSRGNRIDACIRILLSQREQKQEYLQPVIDELPQGVTLTTIAEKTVADNHFGIHQCGWDVAFAIDRTAAEGSGFHGDIRISFDSQERKPKVRAVVPCNFPQYLGVAAPKYVGFGSVAMGSASQKRSLVRCTDSRPFKIVKIRSSSTSFRVDCVMEVESDMHWLDMEFRPQQTGQIKGAIEIETTHPASRTVTIEAYGVAPAANAELRSARIPVCIFRSTPDGS